MNKKIEQVILNNEILVVAKLCDHINDCENCVLCNYDCPFNDLINDLKKETVLL